MRSQWQVLEENLNSSILKLQNVKAFDKLRNSRPLSAFGAPEAVVATKIDEQGKAVMDRPHCSYPQAAQFNDTGDKNVASSFNCGVLSN